MNNLTRVDEGIVSACGNNCDEKDSEMMLMVFGKREHTRLHAPVKESAFNVLL